MKYVNNDLNITKVPLKELNQNLKEIVLNSDRNDNVAGKLLE